MQTTQWTLTNQEEKKKEKKQTKGEMDKGHEKKIQFKK